MRSKASTPWPISSTIIPCWGCPHIEAAEAGAVWRFRNEGNRASFVAHPDVYGPQFGGYDPTDVARGVTFAGNPRFWIISGERLYLFGLEANRDAFGADPGRYLRQAHALAAAGAGAFAVGRFTAMPTDRPRR